MPDILADIFRNNQPAVPPVIDQDDTISKLFRGELDEVNPIPELPPAPAPVTNPPVPEFSRGPVQFGQPKRYTVSQILAGELPQQGSTEDLIREFPESEKDITRMEKDGRTVGTIRQVVEAGLGAGYQGQGTRDGGEGDEYTPDLLHKRERLDIIEGDLQVLTDKAQQRPLLPSEISDYQQLQGEYQQLAEFFQNPDVIRQYRKISPDTIDELGKMGLIIPKSKDEMTYTQGGIWQPQSVEKPHAWWDTRTEQFVDPIRAAENQENIDGNARYVLLDLEEGFSPELLQGFARSAKQVIDTLIGGGMRVAGDIIEGATPNLSLPSARGVPMKIGPEIDTGKARERLHEGAESLQESTQQIFRPEQPTGYYARPPEGLQDAINKFPQLAIDQGPLFAAFMLATQLNPALGMGVMFAAEGGEASERVREYEKKSGTTVDPKKRMAMVTAVGGINAALERIGIEAMFGRMGWTKRLQKQFLGRLTDVLLRTLVESGTEGLQGGIQRINEAFYNEFKRDNIPEEVINRFNQEFWSTIPISVLAAGGSVTGESIAGNQQELAQRQADYQAINDIYGITNRQAGQEFGLADAERIRKETKAGVVVPESGAPDKAGGDNLVRMEAGQQVAELKKLGYSDTLIPFFSRDQRDKIIADQIKPVNLPAELQPVKPRRKPVSERPIREQLDRLDAMEKHQDEIEKRFAEQEKPSAPESPGVLPGERPPVLGLEGVELTPERKTEQWILDRVKKSAPGGEGRFELPIQYVKRGGITVDEKTFQPREEINQEVIDSIKRNPDALKGQAVILWKNPEDGKTYLVAGHHTYYGLEKFDEIPARYLPEGTTLEKAKEYGYLENLQRTEQTDVDNLKVVKNLKDQGLSTKQILEKAPGLKNENKVRNLLKLSHLDPQGDFIKNLDNPGSFPKIRSFAYFVGQLRDQHQLSSTHEQDIFNYLYQQGAAHNPDDTIPKEHLIHTIEAYEGKLPDRIDFSKDMVTGVEARADTQEISGRMRELKREIIGIDRDLNENGAGMSKEERAGQVLRLARRKEELEKLGTSLGVIEKSQTDIFAVGEPMAQYGLFSGVVELVDENQTLASEEAELLQRKRQLDREERYLKEQVSAGKIKAGDAQKAAGRMKMAKLAVDRKLNALNTRIVRLEKKAGQAEQYSVFEEQAGYVGEFGHTYTTKDGQKIDFDRLSEQEHLFGGTQENVFSQPTEGIKIGKPPALRSLKKGEFAALEVKYRKYGGLKFYFDREKVETAEDVAFIFRQLESENIEHAMLLGIDGQGRTIVLHHSSGGVSSSAVYPNLTDDFIDRFGIKKLWFIHNHPSGTITASKDDRTIYSIIKKGLPKGVQLMDGVILNIKDGKYGTFNDRWEDARGDLKERLTGKPVKLKALEFGRRVFNQDVDLESLPTISSSKDVAAYLSAARFSAGKKHVLLVLNGRNQITARLILTQPINKQIEFADEVNGLMSRYGGAGSIIVSNSTSEDMPMQLTLAAIGKIKIRNPVLDYMVVQSESDKYRSAADEGLLREERAEYRVSDLKRKLTKAPPKIPQEYQDKFWEVDSERMFDNARRNRLDAVYQEVIDKKKVKKLEGAQEYKTTKAGVLAETLVPISTRLEMIHPALFRKIRKFEWDLNQRILKDRKGVLPFLEATKKMTREDRKILDLSQKNADEDKINELVKKYGLESEYKRLRHTLDTIYTRALSVDFDVNYLPNYFPRHVKDRDAFLSTMTEKGYWGVFREAIDKKAKEIGRTLTVDEKVELINSMIRGYGNQLQLRKPGALQEREIDIIDQQMSQHYYETNSAILMYINSVNTAIGGREFFGKGDNLHDSIGKYVQVLVDKKAIAPGNEQQLVDILRARFQYRTTTGFWRGFKNLGYITTMGHHKSAITQIGDLAWAFYNAGTIRSIGHLVKGIAGKSNITREDIGIVHIAQEFTDPGRLAKAVDRIFRLTGLTYIDRLGKETLINGTIARYQKMARKEKINPLFRKKLDRIFGQYVGGVIKDLQDGVNSENVKYLAFNTLLDFQPVALSEMPQKYLDSPKGRIFYMLKTFTMKSFDVFRREGMRDINQGRKNHDFKQAARGVKKLVRLAALFVLANATADEIKDWIFGRKTSLTDRVVDNILRLFGMSKYITWYIRREGPIQGIMKLVLPPAPYVMSPFRDSVKTVDLIRKKKFDEFELKDMQTWKEIPFFGQYYYWWFGGGVQKKEKEKRKVAKAQRKGENPITKRYQARKRQARSRTGR